MDLITSCKDKLTYFRIKELKDVLTHLGLSKQGKKQDLVDRILVIFSEERVPGIWARKNAVGKEEVAKLVDDIYRKMQVSGAYDLASRGQGVADSSNVKFEEEIKEPDQMEKIRCPCGNSLPTDSMIKCEGPRCHVWQHIGCVIIPQEPLEGVQPIAPEIFYCELCRLTRADPFWVTVAHPLYPVKLAIINVPTDGTNPMQTTEKTFQLMRADRDKLSKQEYDVQVWCLLLNDKVSFRMQWPQYADLKVNGMPVRAINRPGSQLLGVNGRDDGPLIKPRIRDGINKITLTGCDARVFCFGVRLVKRRTVQQIFNMIPKESDGERFEDALARIQRCVGGGSATENADRDSDLEVVADSIPVNLRCPLSGSRMKVAGRFKPCVHMGCFDLEVFVEMNQRSRKWQCPICLKNYSLEDVIIDPYFNPIISKMHNCEEDVTEVDVKHDGSWRAKTEGDRTSLGDLGKWHFPDGTPSIPVDGQTKPKSEAFIRVKQEHISEGLNGLRIEIKKNQNGFWEVNNTENMKTLLSGNGFFEEFQNHGQNVIPMSSSATGSGRDGEDPSVNQDGCGNFDFSTNNGIELDSFPMNIDPIYAFTDHNPSAPLRENEVIVLSDSDEENEALISAGTVFPKNWPDTNGVTFSVPPLGISEPYSEDPVLGAVGSSRLGLFNSNDDEFMPMLSLPPDNQGVPGFQLFSTDTDVSDTLVDVHRDSANCSTSMNDYTLIAETAFGSAAFVPESCVAHSNVQMNDGLVDNPLAFGTEDPSLQIFLPTGPSQASTQADMRDQVDASTGIHADDWISLRLGDGSGGDCGEPPAANGLDSRQQLPSKDGALDSLADTAASFLLGMNENRSVKTGRERSDGPFSFPRQRRSVRPRLYLSMNSDSE